MAIFDIMLHDGINVRPVPNKLQVGAFPVKIKLDALDAESRQRLDAPLDCVALVMIIDIEKIRNALDVDDRRQFIHGTAGTASDFQPVGEWNLHRLGVQGATA